MNDRTLLVDGVGGDPVRMEVSCGVPQASVIGPCLWNIFYDDLLRMEFHKAVKLVSFADDIALVITAPNADLLENIGNSAPDLVNRWMQENGSQVGEAVVLTKKRANRNPNFSFGDHQIPVKSSMRYLGVQLDTRLNFVTPNRLVMAAAGRSLFALGRIIAKRPGTISV